jgi:plastocyanin
MKKLACATLPLALLVAFALAGCGSPASSTATPSTSSGFAPTVTPASSPSSAPSGNTISMTSYYFTQRSITVQSSQPVVFDDLAGTHPVCVGTGMGGVNTCETASQAPTAPAELVSPGIVLSPGQKVSITFKPGTYHLICTIHPGMYIDVTAQ